MATMKKVKYFRHSSDQKKSPKDRNIRNTIQVMKNTMTASLIFSIYFHFVLDGCEFFKLETMYTIMV